MKIIATLLAAVCLAATASAQPPEDEIPPEVSSVIAEIAEEQGLTPFGDVYLGELDDGAGQTIDIAVAANKITYIQLMGNDDTLSIRVRALAGAKEVAMGAANRADPVIQIPAGSGSTVKLEIEMSCEFISCAYFVQPFVR